MAHRSESTAVPPARDGERRLAAIVFTDVVGYSGVVHKNEALGQKMVDRQDAIVRAVLPRFGGRIVKGTGDGFLIEFDGPQSAVKALAAIQTRLATDPDAATVPVELRTSVHLGEVDHVRGDLYGDGVNIAARLMPLSPEGGIAISAAVRMLVGQQIDVAWRSIGTPALKNIETPVEVFVADPPALHALAASLSGPGMAPDALLRKGPAPRRGLKVAAALAVALLIAAAGIGFVLHRTPGNGSSPAAATPARPSLAVLPFANTGGDPSNEYFSDGLSDELINTLSRVNTLKVMGRGSSFVFKDTKDDSRTIGQKLGVSYLVEGSVRKALDRVRIGVSLVRADDGSNLWSQSYDRELKDIFGVQTEIATAVTAELQRSLGLAATPTTATAPGVGWPPSGNVEAYQALLQGNFHVRRATAADEEKAVEYFEKAIALDPRYAMAHARLGMSLYQSMGLYGSLPPGEQQDRRQRGRAAVAKALELEPDLAMAHVARGLELETIDLRLEDAAKELRRAVELAPNDPIANRRLGRIQFELGHLDQALGTMKRTIALDPLWSDAHGLLGTLTDVMGRYKEAEAAWRKAMELEPQAAQNYAYLAVVKVHAGDPADAVALARQEPVDVWRLWSLSIALFANGDRKAADEVLEQMIREQADGAAFQIAEVYAERRDQERALHWLEHALAVQDPGVSQLYMSSPLAAYRDDPRYAAIARKVGLDPANAPRPPKLASTR